MSGRKRRFEPPKGFMRCPKIRKDYEENGAALGRLYLWHEDAAVEAWQWFGGVLGPKWKLECYRYHWCKDNPKDYAAWKQWARLRRDRMRE